MAHFSDKCKTTPHLYVGQKILIKAVSIESESYFNVNAEIVSFDENTVGADDLDLICCCLDEKEDKISNWDFNDFVENYFGDKGFTFFIERLRNFKGRKFFWASSEEVIPLDPLELLISELSEELK